MDNLRNALSPDHHSSNKSTESTTYPVASKPTENGLVKQSSSNLIKNGARWSISSALSMSSSSSSADSDSSGRPVSYDSSVTLGLGNSHAYTKTMGFILCEGILSASIAGMFTVNDIKGVPRYQVRGRNMKLQSEIVKAGSDGETKAPQKKRVICDVSGKELYEIKQPTFTLHHRLVIHDCKTGEAVLILKKNNPGRRGKKPVISVWMTEGDGHEKTHGKEPWLSIVGDVKTYDFKVKTTVRDQESCCAAVKQIIGSQKKVILKKGEYVAKIHKGNNVPLLLAMVLAVDEFYRPDLINAAFG